MPTAASATDEMLRQRGRSLPNAAAPAQGRIGSGVALTTVGNGAWWKDNPHH